MTELIIPVLMLLGGIALLIYSVEKFVENLTKSALVLGVSSFILAVIFAVMDFEGGEKIGEGEIDLHAFPKEVCSVFHHSPGDC